MDEYDQTFRLQVSVNYFSPRVYTLRKKSLKINARYVCTIRYNVSATKVNWQADDSNKYMS